MKCSVTSVMSLCHPMDSSVHGIFQAGILEWIAVFFFRTRRELGPNLMPRTEAVGIKGGDGF